MNENKSAIISGRILAYLAQGATMEQAFNWVLGPGYYEAMIDELYHELRAVGGK